MKKFNSLLLILFVTYLTVLPNNLQVSTPTLTGQNTGEHSTLVQFNITWDNSWRDVVNWDAAWIFIKYKKNDGIWRHATLNTSGFTAPGGSTIDVTSDGKGAFIYRSANSSGNNSFTNVRIKWNYGSDAVDDNDLVTVKVFAIEMVYVPQGSFWVGDGTTQYVSLCQAATDQPFRITGEGELTLGGVNVENLGTYTNASDDFNTSTTQILPAAFPKGYNAFYCMKYECSQGQYTDFLNTITINQAYNRFDSTFSNIARLTITKSGTTFSCTRPDRACGYISYRDFLAYADWAGLRPMTELEYEKSCRGDQYPVLNEYSWGSTTIIPATTISGTEDGTEIVTTVNANCNVNNPNFIGGDGGNGPLRCGIFAKNSTTREQAGASYYGIMELTGNLQEMVFSLSTSETRLFSGVHGDGNLSSQGAADVSNWQTYVLPFPTLRGSYYTAATTFWGLCVSYRNCGSGALSFDYRSTSTIRCVRTAPTSGLMNNNSENKVVN